MELVTDEVQPSFWDEAVSGVRGREGARMGSAGFGDEVGPRRGVEGTVLETERCAVGRNALGGAV